MEGNRDEAERCLAFGKKFIAEGEIEKGLKYLSKADKLYPSQEAKDIIASVERAEKNGQGDAGNCNGNASRRSSDQSQQSKEEPRRPNAPTSSTPNGRASSPGASQPEFTTDQVEAVRKIKKCKDYYEILGIAKDSSESDLKKQYRKLALQFHPDKNKAPGAAEAFKAIGNAFAVLSDKEKRRQYDLYGSDEQIRQRQHQTRSAYYEEDYTRGFEGDISAEEIFNMFFGGGFPSGNVYVRRGNRWREANARQQAQHQHHEMNASGYSVLLQMLPVIVLICLSLMSSLFVSEPAYSLTRTSKYMYERKTTNLEVQYYVREHFERDYKGSIRRIEAQVEEDYVNNLRGACFREKNYRENMIWRARNFRDPGLEEKARSMKTPSCDHLQKISRDYMTWS